VGTLHLINSRAASPDPSGIRERSKSEALQLAGRFAAYIIGLYQHGYLRDDSVEEYCIGIRERTWVFPAHRVSDHSYPLINSDCSCSTLLSISKAIQSCERKYEGLSPRLQSKFAKEVTLRLLAWHDDLIKRRVIIDSISGETAPLFLDGAHNQQFDMLRARVRKLCARRSEMEVSILVGMGDMDSSTPKTPIFLSTPIPSALFQALLLHRCLRTFALLDLKIVPACSSATFALRSKRWWKFDGRTGSFLGELTP